MARKYPPENGLKQGHFYPPWLACLLFSLWTCYQMPIMYFTCPPIVIYSLIGFFFLGLLVTFQIVSNFCKSWTVVLFMMLSFWWQMIYTSILYIWRGPRLPNWTFSFEIATSVVRCMMAHAEGAASIPNAQQIRNGTNAAYILSGQKSCEENKTTLTPVIHNGLEHLWLEEKEKEKTKNCFVVLYIHGGAYVIGCARQFVEFGNHLMHHMKKIMRDEYKIKDASVSIFLTDYRKAPEYIFPTAVEDVLASYDYLVQTKKIPSNRIILCGDSAGAGLVMSALIRLRDGPKKISLPRAGMCLCPYVDMSPNKGPPTPHCILSETFLKACRKAYLPDYKDPSSWKDASSVHCDLSGLPPLYIVAADKDLLYPHAIKLAKKAEANGTQVELVVHPNMIHDFFVYPPDILPYTSIAIHQMAAYAAQKFATVHEQTNGV